MTTMNDPDFIHLVEANRLQKSVSNTSSQKTQAQSTKTYMNETITLRFEDGSISNIPRFRLENDFVQNAVNRVTAAKKAASATSNVSISHLILAKESNKDISQHHTSVFSYLYHHDSNTIIMPDNNMKTRCLANVTYHVISRPAITIKEGGLLSRFIKDHAMNTHAEYHYDGEIVFIVHNVPTTSQNGLHEVTANDLRRWIVSGAICNLETIDVLTKKVETLKRDLLQIEHEVKTLPTEHDGGKRVAIGSQSSKGKKAKYLSDEIERINALLHTTTQSLETLYAQHVRNCTLSIEKRSNLSHGKTCDWAIFLTGDEEKTYAKLIEQNKNWSLVPFYAFGTVVKSKQTHVILNIPVKDLSGHFVDTGGVTMTKIPHGFGIYESYVEVHPYLNSKTKTRHRLYHGKFHEGDLCEGSLYTDSGVYSGKFVSNEPTSFGKMEYADGIKISGHFASPETTPTNPYSHGIPHGQVHIRFPDKSSYEGSMYRGRITGEGVYKEEGLQKRGQFKDGVLDNDESEDNLHLSFMFGGERLWGTTTTR